MKKTWLQGELTLSSIYILLMIVFAVASNEGRFVAAIMLFFLGAWQYPSALIWIIAGDRIRIKYFVAASMLLLLLWSLISAKFSSRIERPILLVGMICSVALAIWYQFNTYRHIQALEKSEQLAEEALNQDLL